LALLRPRKAKLDVAPSVARRARAPQLTAALHDAFFVARGHLNYCASARVA
jgi:hypothetical protein